MRSNFLKTLRDPRGIALITVVSVLALATILLLALFSSAENEFKSTQGYAAGQSARQLSESAVNLVIGQLQKAAETTTTPRTIHVTQPGGARKYSANGQFVAGYKLFSDAEMEVTTPTGPNGELRFLQGKDGQPVPPAWNTRPNRFVDLNEPVVRSENGGTGLELYFPIVDPRSFTTNTSTPSVEGFSYSQTAPAIGSGSASAAIYGVVLPTVGDPLRQRLPMPVEWIYVLQDGTLGTLNDSNVFLPAPGGGTASLSNPIVGRIAFWTDDESCKVNVNTASEPTFWGVPRFYHEREHEWAEMPSTAREYQRFPGHPATVALSSVLYPNPQQTTARDLVDLFGRSAAEKQRIIAVKEAIYTMIPKINLGGSKCGTLVFAPDSQPGVEAAKVDLTNAARERLFASLDEMLFTEDSSGNKRTVNNIVDSAGNVIFDESVLERSRFFLTAHSRAPEFSILGLPRISIWPVHENDDARYRTPWDQLIAFCSTFKGSGTSSQNTYFFQRARAHDASYDISINRNASLMRYLLSQMQTQMPNTGGSGSSAKASFEAKYGTDNARQILVQIFDYIRSTNLYDDILSKNNSLIRSPTDAPKSVYMASPSLYFTYTNPLALRNRTTDGNTTVTARDVADNGWPGHGQVTPSQWRPGGGSVASRYTGFGRSFTISEVGLQFICTADGMNDANSFRCPANDPAGVVSGGGTSERINPNVENEYINEGVGVGKAYPYAVFPDNSKSYWYSNYPPFPNPNKFGARVGAGESDPANPNKHPAYDPINWNGTLAENTELTTTEKRIQALLNLELFVPAEGWTLIYPEYTIVLDGDYLSRITVNNQAVFSTAKDTVIKSGFNVYTPSGVHRTGGVTPPRALYSGYKVKGMGKLPADYGYDTTDSTAHGKLLNCDLVSSFFTVPRDEKMEIKFPATGGITIKIYDTHDWERTDPIQVMEINFSEAFGSPSISTPTPQLARRAWNKRRDFPNGRQRVIRAVEGPRFWAFNSDGALGRWYRTGLYNPFHTNVQKVGSSTSGNVSTDPNGMGERLLGRFVGVEGFSIFYNETGSSLGSDIIRSTIPALGDYRLVAGRYQVPTSIWSPHRFWSDDSRPTAHNFSAHAGDPEAGVDLGDAFAAGADATQFVKVLTKRYINSKVPDMPRTALALQALNSFMDYDNGVGSSRDGAFVNKPDEGNFSKLNFWRNPPGSEKELRNAYFTDSWEMEPDKSSDDRYFTPNRMLSSPVMFGSMPTAMFDSPTGGVTGYTGPGRPWQTLLFRPHAPMPNVSESGPSEGTHPGAQNPPDHYILDMFNMPVVEPYAISEPLSQAGKVNVNYQIVPFTYINRATGLWAVLKGEVLEAVSNAAAGGNATGGSDGTPNYKAYKSSTFPYTFWTEGTAATDAYWHRRINVAETIKQFEERFNFDVSVLPATRKGLLRSPSQICEMHLIPTSVPGSAVVPMTITNRETEMGRFWQSHALTGDNSRERPYANIYPKLTTRSNTFRVHFRTQVIKKARSTNPAEFVQGTDAVLSEYRGSTLIERYIDPNDVNNPLPDYATGDPMSKATLDSFYRFRVIEHKRFAP